MSALVTRILSLLLVVLLAISLIVIAIDFPDGDFNASLTWSYVLAITAAVLAIAFPIVTLITNPKAAIKTLASLVALAVVLGIAYGMGSAEPLQLPTEVFDNARTLKLTDMGLYTMYILAGIAVFAIAFTEISKLLK